MNTRIILFKKTTVRNFFQRMYALKVIHVIEWIFFIILGIGICLFLIPQTHYVAGNIFFGGVPKLYNVDFARYFFVYAAYPPIGESVPYAHHQLSRTYFIQGNLRMALDEARKEIVIYPEHSRTYYILGLTLGYLGKENEAIDAFSKFIEANPITWAARNDKAWLQFRVGDVDGALETIKPVVSDELNPWIQNTYGTLLLNVGKYSEAKKAFLHAREAVSIMSEEQWGNAYPGNDPRVYATGLSAMKRSIESNLVTLENK